jgi:glycopeptide antibiotics resistance protein
MMMTPFWEYKNLIFSSNHVYWFQQISCNILMLIPLGFLFPLMFQRFRKPLVTVFTGFSLSVFIEIAQYFTSRGLCEFDDVFNNTIGALIGYVIYRKSLFRL